MSSGAQLSAQDFVVVLVTVPTHEVAASLAKTLVEEKLVACVNILPGVRSIYSWKGTVCDDAELLCVLKTRRALFSTVRERVIALHPYELPEVIALPLTLGHEPYLNWLQNETRVPDTEDSD
jgi:periplasmic divalent cation tolerance protein